MAQIKSNGVTISIEYSPGMHFSNVCMYYKYLNNVRARKWNVTLQYFLTCERGIFHICQFN